jgi:hypothetical protein
MNSERERILYASHRARVEGVRGEEKAWHGLARVVRRGLANMKIQAYLTARSRKPEEIGRRSRSANVIE